ncbi:uncharacterized protein BP5553_09715 [Venustampulla echinocandica]|uniref:Zn(2)-C6 fungal-type domain-containing protein n=1 Tax=Venustampulla echinocandica TaxID=2656787 RepID=A0A370TBU9_9HELO|nr:uncharacterized protein BP5553_09715 [Venustampulla echinocandica]RDL31506.1 hypothetical protein BP5553_09715 [Venustampulla echinocandica]
MPKRGRGAKRPGGKNGDGDNGKGGAGAGVSPGQETSLPNLASPASASREPSFASTHSPQSWQHMSSSSSSHQQAQQPQPPPGKVAIPALRSPWGTDPWNKGPKKIKTPHACDNCRKAKAGCTGELPCLRCKNTHVPCVYNEGKRDRDRLQLSRLNHETEMLSQRNAEITEALYRIQLDQRMTGDDIRAEIKSILDRGPTKMPPNQSQSRKRERASEQTKPRVQEDDNDRDDSTEIGSTGSMDFVSMDMDRDDIRPTGHLGKPSSVALAQRTAEECQKAINEADLRLKNDSYVSSSYHTKESDINPIDTSKINRPESTDLSWDDMIFLGTLNIIFAISSYYAHLKKSEHRGPHYDHLIYVARAKMLCMDQGLLYEDQGVTTICATGLLSLYYVATSRLNRAWTLCGLVIRNSLTLGLHVRSEADDLAAVEKEHRVRVWWALYSLECLLNELTGRPTCISDRDISTPLPINVSEDDFHFGQALYDKVPDASHPGKANVHDSYSTRVSSRDTPLMDTDISQSSTYLFPIANLPLTSSTYFIYRTQLSIISHQIFTQLYSPATVKLKWFDIQETIRIIDRRLQTWQESLPEQLDVDFETFTAPDWDDPYLIQRIGLAILLMSSRMILFRPCLCRFDMCLRNQSEKSKDFNQDAAETCIRSARRMISLLSWSATSADKLYAITPWWTTLHYLCEALSVLMLEMAFKLQHMPNDAAYVLDDAKRGVSWLSMMAEQSISARKAWEIFDKLIRLVAPLIHWSVFDLPTEAPVPPGYNWRGSHLAGQMLPPLSSPPLPNPPHVQNHPPEQLSQMNIQRHQNTQVSMMSPGSITAAWTAQPPSFQPFADTGGYEQYGYLANPLDHVEALNRFSMISQLHGSFDEPWMHILEPPNLESSDIESSNIDPALRTYGNPGFRGVQEPQGAEEDGMEFLSRAYMNGVDR